MRTVFVIALCVGIALAGQSKIRGEKKSKTRRGGYLTNSYSRTLQTNEKRKSALVLPMCTDTITNCAAYTKAVCTPPAYADWVAQHCCAFCGGPIYGGAIVSPIYGGAIVSRSLQTNEKRRQVAALYLPPCVDKIPNCAMYGQPVCTDLSYAAWARENCCAFCRMYEGIVSRTLQTNEKRRQVAGCVYNGQVYSQGQTWRDACKFSCTCVDGSAGKYQCQQLCVTWDLPHQCSMNPPQAGKCCSTPTCPVGFNILYPPGYVAN